VFGNCLKKGKKMEASIHCKYDQLLNPKKLKDHPKNRNKHSDSQLDRLSKLYQSHGIRHPIIVSKKSGFIVAGHARKMAALKAGISAVPVVYQEFETDEQEYAFIHSDNAIAAWAELDLAGINADLGDLGPDFDIDLLGIKNFTLDPADLPVFNHEKGKSNRERYEEYNPMTVRKLEVILSEENYGLVIDGLDKKMERDNLKSYTEAVVAFCKEELTR
jgi:hypothetical protein